MSVTDDAQTDGRKSLCLILNSPNTEFCETCPARFQVNHVLDDVQYKTELRVRGVSGPLSPLPIVLRAAIREELLGVLYWTGLSCSLVHYQTVWNGTGNTLQFRIILSKGCEMHLNAGAGAE